MTERIKQLVEQAFIITTDGKIGHVNNYMVEKFAELIVDECCKRLGEETIRHDGYGYNQHELYNRLRKHFGVEE